MIEGAAGGQGPDRTTGGQGARARRRDRRGRGQRGPLAWPAVPAMVGRRERFDDLVLESAARLEHHLADPQELEYAVEDVPPAPAPGFASEVALGRLYPATGGRRARVVVYRRPVETRATDPRDLATLVHDVVLEQVATHLGRAPEDLDEGYGEA